MKLAWRLSVNPIVNSNSPLFRDLARLNVTTAQFSTYAQGGFGDGEITIEDAPTALITEASDHWLGKRIVATDPAGRVAYEGFVAEVSATNGQSNYRRTLDGFANRMYVEFTFGGSYAGYGKCPKKKTCKGVVVILETDADVDPNGITTTTLGIKEEWTDAAGSSVTSPTNARAQGVVKLKEKLRARTADWQSAENAAPQISLSLWGYYSTLQWRKQSKIYKSLTEIATIVNGALSGKSQYISTDRTHLDTTGNTVKFNGGAEKMWLQDYIQQVVAMGDSNGRRLFFQIWQDRVPYLFARSTAVRYYGRADSKYIWNAAHERVEPYLIHAGGILIDESIEHALDKRSDAIDTLYRTVIEQTTYDDVTETLTIPPPTEIEMSTERLLARARRSIRHAI